MILSAAVGQPREQSPVALARGITRPDQEISPLRAVGTFFFGVDEAVLYNAPQTILTTASGALRSAGLDYDADLAFQAAARNREWWNSQKPQLNNAAEQILYGFGSTLGKVGVGAALRMPVVGAAALQSTQSAIDSAVSGVDAQTSAMRGAVSGLALGAGVALPFSIPLLRGSGALSATAQRLGYGVGSNIGLGVAERSADYGILQAAGYSKEAAKVNIFDPTALATDAVLGLAFGGLARWADIRKAKADIQMRADEQIKASRQNDLIAHEGSAAPVTVTPEQRAVQTADQARTNADAITQTVAQQAETRLKALEAEAAKRPFSRGEKKALDAKVRDLEAHKARFDEPDTERIKELADAYKQRGKLAREAKRKAIETEAAERKGKAAEVQRQIDDIRSQLGVYGRAKAAEAAVSRLQQKLRGARNSAEIAAALDDVKLMEQAQQAGWREIEELLRARESITGDMVDAALVKNLEFDAADKIPGKPADGTMMARHNEAMADAMNSIYNDVDQTYDIVGNVKTKLDQRLINKVANNIEAIVKHSGDDLDYANIGMQSPLDDLSQMKTTPDTQSSVDADIVKATDDMIDAIDDKATFTLEDGTTLTGAELKQRFADELAEVNETQRAIENQMMCFIEGGPNV